MLPWTSDPQCPPLAGFRLGPGPSHCSSRLAVTVLEGGGHIASLELRDRPGVNPLWVPVWRGIEPWQYRRGLAGAYGGSRLLAAICGHNLCLGCFGGPSESEGRAAAALAL